MHTGLIVAMLIHACFFLHSLACASPINTSSWQSVHTVADAQDYLETMLDGWENLILRLPNNCGRMVHRQQVGTVIDSYSTDDFKLYSVRQADGSGFTNFSNPDYFAAVVHDGGNSLASLNQEIQRRGFPSSPFRHTSVVNHHYLIPSLLRDGTMKVVGFQRDGSAYRVTLEPTNRDKTGEVKEVELEFRDKILLPVMLQMSVPAQGFAQVIRYNGFVETCGALLPTSMTTEGYVDGKVSGSSVDKIEYFPNEQLDTTRCFLKHYDIAEPGKRATKRFWLAGMILLIAMVCLILLALRR